MKKLITFILALILSVSSFAIVDFEGVDWGDSKHFTNPIFSTLKKEPSFRENTEIYSASAVDPHIKNYQLFFKNEQLYMIRIIFNKEVVGKDQIKNVYRKLTRTLGAPTERKVINKKVDSLTLQGNYIRFNPDSDTTVYYIGVDTINSQGDMIDSNLYLDYVDSTALNEPEL